MPLSSVNAVLLLKTYHEVAQPIRLLAQVREAMRPGARLGIIDRNGRGDDHGIDSKTVIKEEECAGFTPIKQYDFVKPDEVLVFQARSDARLSSSLTLKRDASGGHQNPSSRHSRSAQCARYL